MKTNAQKIMAAITAISMLYLAYLLFDRRNVVEVTNVRIDPTAVRAGDLVMFSFDAMPLRRGACEGVVHAYEIDSTGAVFLFEPNRPLSPKPEGKHHYSREFTTHKGLSVGEVRYGRDIEHWCNALQKLLWPMRERREVTYTVIP